MKGTQNFFRRASGSDQSKTMSAARAFSALIFLAICQVLYFPVFSSASDGAPSSRQTGLRDDWHVTAGEALSPGIADMAADSLFWQGDTLTLREVTISASFNSSKSSPLRLSTVTSGMLKDRAAARTYPELLKNIPGLYATSESGSYGDARLNIRGFKQENISVLLNGIPISGLTTGSMYWNNWMGLADATYAIQVQKGIGSSMLSDSSVGGSVNIITAVATEEASVEAGAYVSHYGTAKGYLKYDSGQLKQHAEDLLGERLLALPEKTTVLEYAALIGQCSVILSVDSAAVHLANGSRVPAFCLYGGLDPDGIKRWGPAPFASECTAFSKQGSAIDELSFADFKPAFFDFLQRQFHNELTNLKG